MKMIEEKQLKAMGRGSFDWRVEEACSSCAVRWFDNRPVNLVSTAVGIQPMGTIRRWDRKDKKYVDIPCPAVIKHYNSFMGGIDLHDSLTVKYNYRIKTHRWCLYLSFHTLHIAVVNAWFLYRRDLAADKLKYTNILTLKEFQYSIAFSMILCNKPRGRPPLSQESTLQRKRPCPNSTVPDDVLYDMADHFLIWREQRHRCIQCPQDKALPSLCVASAKFLFAAIGKETVFITITIVECK